MKLIRMGERGAEVPGILDSTGVPRSLGDVVPDVTGEALAPEILARIQEINLSTLPPICEGTRYGPPIAGTGKIICVGLNYVDHATESSMTPPSEPVLFFKATTSICGAYDDVVIPIGSRKTDWEVELGVVIGRTAKRVGVAEALDHVGGFLIVNDLSERESQLERGGQWVKGKSYDTFGPIGPWLVTRDEIPDSSALSLRLSVNGQVCQNGNSRNMIFNVPTLVSYISQFMTLMPGDIISTGTPAGVGLGMKPPRFLLPNDVMELSIEGLGTQRHRIVAEALEVSDARDRVFG